MFACVLHICVRDMYLEVCIYRGIIAFCRTFAFANIVTFVRLCVSVCKRECLYENFTSSTCGRDDCHCCCSAYQGHQYDSAWLAIPRVSDNYAVPNEQQTVKRTRMQSCHQTIQNWCTCYQSGGRETARERERKCQRESETFVPRGKRELKRARAALK